MNTVISIPAWLLAVLVATIVSGVWIFWHWLHPEDEDEDNANKDNEQ